MKNFVLIFIFLFSVWIPHISASEITGIIPGQIWYSQDIFSEGDTVKIYTAIWNNNKESLSVKVEFYDKNVVLGSRDVVIASDQVKEVYVSWKVTSGDHTISAKIISSELTNLGVKSKIILNRLSTNEDKKFIPAIVTNIDGTPATSADVIKSQLDIANSKISEVIPNSISQPVSGVISSLDVLRDETSQKIDTGKEAVQKQLAILASKKVITNSSSQVANKTEKPIAYLKLFFLSVLSFIFGSKFIFYGLILLILFFILRFLYFKIRYR